MLIVFIILFCLVYSVFLALLSLLFVVYSLAPFLFFFVILFINFWLSLVITLVLFKVHFYSKVVITEEGLGPKRLINFYFLTLFSTSEVVRRFFYFIFLFFILLALPSGIQRTTLT